MLTTSRQGRQGVCDRKVETVAVLFLCGPFLNSSLGKPTCHCAQPDDPGYGPTSRLTPTPAHQQPGSGNVCRLLIFRLTSRETAA